MENMFVLLVNVLYGTCIYRRATIVKVANTGVQHCSLRFGHNVSVRDIITNSEAPLTTTRTNYDQELTITRHNTLGPSKNETPKVTIFISQSDSVGLKFPFILLNSNIEKVQSIMPIYCLASDKVSIVSSRHIRNRRHFLTRTVKGQHD